MKAKVLNCKLIENNHQPMSIQSTQTYNLIVEDMISNEVVKNIYFNDSKEVYEYYQSTKSRIEREAMKHLVKSLIKHNLV